ncbi:hypothetical protein QYF36_004777 [Acer negundo]|nr:hypothetical protein QYF36_004777 [Acer negundo]
MVFKTPFLLSIFFVFFLVSPSLCAPIDDVVSCLTHNSINNFTTFPSKTENPNCTANNYYFKLLDFSIQNLRFAEPKVPKPIAIILPDSAEQVKSSVLCCTKASVEIRVRCGGHSYEGTSAVANDGAPFVIVDMINMNRVMVDSESETAWVEGGATLEDCKEMSWIESILFFSGLSNGSSISDLKNRYLQDKNYFKAKSDYVKTQISFTGIKAALDILEKEPKGYVILDPYGGLMNKISSDSIAFPHRKGNLFTIQYLVAWYEENNEKSDGYIEWIRELYKAMTPFVSWGPRAAYVNYMDVDLGVVEFINTGSDVPSQDEDIVEIARAWGENYFLKNYDRLVRAKTLIDPNNIFTHQQAIFPMSFSSSYSMALEART